MTGDEIIALAKQHFGETTATSQTVTDGMWLNFLNAAIRTLYHALPVESLRELYTAVTVSVGTDGSGPLPASLERLIDVYAAAGVRLMEISPGMLPTIDASSYNVPDILVYARGADKLYVRPKPGAATSYSVVHVAKPVEIETATKGSEVTALNDDWHSTAAALMASWAYAQEEDAEQAGHYLAVAEREVGTQLPRRPEREVAA